MTETANPDLQTGLAWLQVRSKPFYPSFFYHANDLWFEDGPARPSGCSYSRRSAPGGLSLFRSGVCPAAASVRRPVVGGDDTRRPAELMGHIFQDGGPDAVYPRLKGKSVRSCRGWAVRQAISI